MASGSDVYVTFGADTAALEAGMALARANVAAYTREIAGLARQMQATGAAADSELGQKMQAVGAELGEAQEKFNKFKSDLGSGGEESSKMAEALDRVRETIDHIAEIAGISLGVDAFKEWVASSAELGEKMENVGHELGITASQASELSGIAKLTGTDFETLTHDVERFNLQIQTNTTSRASEGLRALGLSAKEFIGLPIEAQLDKLAEATANFADGGNKAAAIMAILGRNGDAMIPFLDRGKEGLDELRDSLESTRAIMSDQMAAAFAGTNEDIHAMEAAWQGLSNRIFDVVDPAIDAAIRKITSMISSLDEQKIRSGVIAITDDAAAAITAIGDLAIEISKVIEDLLSNIEKVKAIGGGAIAGAAVGSMAGGVGAVPGAIIGGSLAGAADTVKQFFDGTNNQIASGVQTTQQIRAQFDTAVQGFRTSLEQNLGGSGGAWPWGGLPSGVGGTQAKPQAGAMDITKPGAGGVNDAARAAIESVQGEIKAYQDSAKQQLAILDQEFKAKQISNNDKLQSTLDYLQDELQDEQAALDQELALGNLSLTAKQRILNQKAQLEAEYQQAVIKAETEAAEESAKAAQKTVDEWNRAFSTLNSSLTSQIDPLLKGSETVGEAFKNMFAKMVEDAIKAFAELALRWAENQALQMAGITATTTATVAGQAAQTAALASGAAAQKAINASTVSGDAGRAAAGVYAALAGTPFIGPIIAPAAAATAFAAVEAFGSFDKGTLRVPDDMMALIHRNEVVIPAGRNADAYRAAALGDDNAGSKGHVTVNHSTHFTVNAVDADGVKNFFKNNSKPIMGAINHGIKTGTHLGFAKLNT